MEKILIFGFPHCGTSILKSIIGHSEDMFEILDEIGYTAIKVSTTKKYVLCKSPFISSDFFGHKFDGFIKIFIIRNPLWVFSSLNKRFLYNIPSDHNIDLYIDTLNQFIYYKTNRKENLYLIRYEDMFDNNYQNLKNIFNSIGFKYTEKIFNNKHFQNTIISGTNIDNKMPDNANHAEYRTWQINQPFRNNNDCSKIDLSKDQIYKICENSSIDQIYPDIKLKWLNRLKRKII